MTTIQTIPKDIQIIMSLSDKELKYCVRCKEFVKLLSYHHGVCPLCFTNDDVYWDSKLETFRKIKPS